MGMARKTNNSRHCIGIFGTFNCLSYIWALHPILLTLFLVVFGNEVTKIFVIVCSFFIPLAHFALQKANIVQKIMQPKCRKPKNDVTKICDEPGNNLDFHNF